MNNLLWAEWSNIDEDNVDEVKHILNAFDGVINGLLTLEDKNWVFNNLNSSESEKDCYFNLYGELDGGFAGLAEEIEKLRSVLVGGALDWNEIKRSLD